MGMEITTGYIIHRVQEVLSKRSETYITTNLARRTPEGNGLKPGPMPLIIQASTKSFPVRSPLHLTEQHPACSAQSYLQPDQTQPPQLP